MTADPRLLVPATAALLEGWCGPVVTRSMIDAGEPDAITACLGAGGGRVRLVGWSTDIYPIGEVFLDASRDEVADRLARCVAAMVMDDRDLEYVRECGVYWWGKGPTVSPHRGTDDPLRWLPGERRWRLCSWMSIGERVFVADASQVRQIGASGHHPDEDPKGTVADPNYLVVPALAALDPSDDARLSGGARLVDRLALAAVAREVLP